MTRHLTLHFAAAMLAGLALPATANTYTKTDTHTYEDHLGPWVLGQPAKTTNENTGFVESEVVYDATTALPIRTYRFGKLQQTLEYYGGGNLKSSSDGRDHGSYNTTVAYSNWKRGLPQRIDFPDGTYRTLSIDDYGLIRWVEDENRYRTCYSFDAMGRLAGIQYPSETVLQACDGAAAHWFGMARTFETVDVAERGLAAGHWRELVRTSRNYKYVYYDALWRPVLTRAFDFDREAETLSQVVTRYDIDGRPVFQSYPTRAAVASFTQSLPGTRTTYDALGRTTRVEQDAEDDVGGVIASTTQYLDNFTTRSIDARGNATSTQYRTLDQPTTEWPTAIAHPGGVHTDILRNTFGLPITLTRRDAASAVSATRTYAYNTAMELCRVVEPETGATLNGYDAAGNLAWSASGLAPNSLCDAEGDTAAILARKVERRHDQRNRITHIDFPDDRGNTTYAYTPDGLPAVQEANNFSGNRVFTTFDYNRRRLLVRETMDWDTISWPVTQTYNRYGHVATQSYPGNVSVAYAPNALGQPTQAGTYATGVTYHANGAIAGFTYGNGIVHSLTQNARQLPLRSRDANGATPVLDDSYDYDQNGNVLAISDGTAGQRGDRDMTYDALDRLASATSAAMFGGKISYGYDALDNIATLVAPGRNLRYCHDAGNRLAFVRSNATNCTSGAATTTLTYDVQGNVTGKNNVAYDFDFGNRLRSANDGATATTYAYDAAGRRVRDITGASRYTQYTRSGQVAYTADNRKRENTNYIYLGGSLVATRTVPAGSTTATVEYQHTDALGTPVVVTNASGAIVRKSEYEPYGRVVNRAMQDGVGFTGHVEDGATGLVQAQQRYLDQELRFLSVDPMAVDSRTGWNFNRYNYAANNPYRYKDPDGRAIDTIVDIGFVAYSTYRLVTEPSWINAAALGADIVGAATPFATGLGSGVRAAAHAQDAGNVTSKELRSAGRSDFKVSKADAQAQSGGRCDYCGSANGSQGDHIKPLKSFADDVNAGRMTANEAVKQANSPDNIASACASCNPSKGAKALSGTPGPDKFVPSEPSDRIHKLINP